MLVFFAAEPNQLSISLSGASLKHQKSVPTPLKTLLPFPLGSAPTPPAVPSGLLHWLLSVWKFLSYLGPFLPLLSLGYCLMKVTAKNSNSIYLVGTYAFLSLSSPLPKSLLSEFPDSVMAMNIFPGTLKTANCLLVPPLFPPHLIG